MTSATNDEFKNPFFVALFAIAIVGSLWAIWQKAERDDKTVTTTSAGTVITATVAAGPTTGLVLNGTGAVSSQEVMTIETTTGIYVVDGRHSLQKGEAMRIEQTRTGQRRLCSPTFCGDLRG